MQLTTAARNNQVNEFADLLDGGKLVLHSVAHGEVATLTFGTPAFGAASGGQAAHNAIASDSSATGGTVDHAHLLKSDDTDLAQLTVGVGSGEVQLTSLTIGAGDEVSANIGGVITQDAS